MLYLGGNPFLKKIKNYRKRMIAEFPELRYLVSKSVTERMIDLSSLKIGDMQKHL